MANKMQTKSPMKKAAKPGKKAPPMAMKHTGKKDCACPKCK